MTNPILSFCIPVYNQVDLVKQLVLQILNYQSDDIEIVISDDCSTDNIKEMISTIGDSRIRYYRNKSNLGHDLNIIESFRRAKSNYAFLLRSRDGVIVENIVKIIQVIQSRKNVAYITGSALDENNKIRIRYLHDSLIEDRMKCIEAHYSLYVHPSGGIYNISLLNLDETESFIRENFFNKYSFIVDDLFRISLSIKGSFYIISDPTWIYTNTSQSKDVAVNKLSNGLSVYTSELILARYKAEMLWNDLIMTGDAECLKYSAVRLFQDYLYQITWGQKRRNSNAGIRAHYQIDAIKSNIYKDTVDLYKAALHILRKSWLRQEDVAQIEKTIRILILNNSIYGGIKYFGACIMDFLGIKYYFDTWRRNRGKEY